jgi:hypothetical protein
VSKASDNYATPDWLMQLFEGYFDPCPLNSEPEINGLNVEWGVRTYVNPPYSNPLPWIEKAIEEHNKGKLIVMLLKLDCTTKWYRKLVEADAHFIYPGERIKFNGNTPPFSNVIVILN